MHKWLETVFVPGCREEAGTAIASSTGDTAASGAEESEDDQDDEDGTIQGDADQEEGGEVGKERRELREAGDPRPDPKQVRNT